jgi:hypothetical protein
MNEEKKLCMICHKYILAKIFKNHFIECRKGLINKADQAPNQNVTPKKSCGCSNKR